MFDGSDFVLSQNYPFLSSPPHRTFSISRKESEVVLFGLPFKIKGNKM